MKTLKDYILNEKLGSEDLKDLEICVKSVIDRLCWGQEYQEYDTKSNWIKALKDAEKNPDKSELYERVIEILKSDYDFDLADNDVQGSVSEFVKKCAKEEIPEWEVTLKYTK